MDDFYFGPSFIKATPGETITLHLKNEGKTDHTFTSTASTSTSSSRPTRRRTSPSRCLRRARPSSIAGSTRARACKARSSSTRATRSARLPAARRRRRRRAKAATTTDLTERSGRVAGVNRLGRRDQPLPAPARRQPGRLVPVGRRGVRGGARARQARSCCRSATPPATGATSWPTSRSRTRRPRRVMNELFVNVKVDREERPDVDAIYMEATQAMTGSGGWPMTVFMHARRPAVLLRHVLPEASRGGHAGFLELCRADRRRVAQPARRAARAGRPADRAPSGASACATARRRALPGTEALDGAPTAARSSSTTTSGAGSGGAPKFPQTMSLELLLRAHARNRSDADALRPSSRPRSTPWPPAASTTTSAAGSPATRSTTLARAPLREDALRPGAARPRCTCTRGRSPASRATARCSTRRSPTCCATCATRRRLLLGRGRRLRGRGGQVLRLDLDEIRDVLGDAIADARHRLVRRDRRRQLRGPQHPQPHRRTAATCSGPPRSSAPGRRCSRPARRGCGPGSTTRCSPSGTG